MTEKLGKQSIVCANEQFWRQMLAMELVPMPGCVDLMLNDGHIVASVELDGAWRGRIELRLSAGLARAATGAMMMQVAELVEEADVLDGAREMVNMVAGVIKSSLPRPCVMTLPESRVENRAFRSAEAGGDSVSVAFSHPSGDLLVCAWEIEQI